MLQDLVSIKNVIFFKRFSGMASRIPKPFDCQHERSGWLVLFQDESKLDAPLKSYYFPPTKMAHFTLDDAEIENLVSDIIKFNRAKQIAEWLKKIPDARPPSVFHPENDPTNKLMGYKDYNLGFYYAVAAGE